MFSARIVKRRRELQIDVALEVEPGGALALIGASGAGKSTVLACIAGVETPDDGSVRLGATTFFPPSMPVSQRGLGYLTQAPNLFPFLRVDENVRFGLPKTPSPEQLVWVETLRNRLDLGSVWRAPAAAISGGQARRVALARALALRPSLLLLDEPFSGLDRQLSRKLVEDLLFWSRTLGFSMIVVDHRAEILERLCPEAVIALEAGRVVQRGRWSEFYAQPATPLLRSLLAPL